VGGHSATCTLRVYLCRKRAKSFQEIIAAFSMQIDQNNCTDNIWNKPKFIVFDLKFLKAKILLKWKVIRRV